MQGCGAGLTTLAGPAVADVQHHQADGNAAPAQLRRHHHPRQGNGEKRREADEEDAEGQDAYEYARIVRTKRHFHASDNSIRPDLKEGSDSGS